jgi:sortase A
MTYRDKRPVEDLTIEELERILVIRKRESRENQMRRMQKSGRILPADAPKVVAEEKPISEIINQQLEALSSGTSTPSTPAPVSVQPPPLKTTTPRFDEDEKALHEDIAHLRQRQQEARDRIWRRFVNMSLLLVEVAAVFGLIFMGLALFQSIQKLETETATVQQEANATRSAMVPTLEPTAVLRLKLNDVVLPGGHITELGNIRFNQEEIPSHLLPLVKAELDTPTIERPPKTPETALRISIPKLNLDESIVQGSDWEALKQGVGQVLNGSRPGDDTGNVALSAHNDVYGELFKNLDQLEVGDQFTIQTERSVYVYEIREIQVVEPTDVWVMQNTGVPTATLISCYPYRVNTQRIVVFADRIN